MSMQQLMRSGAVFGLVLAIELVAMPERSHAAKDDPPGTQYPSMKIVFPDPLTGRTIWRMTTDGSQKQAANQMGDLSSEVTSWSPDSTRITYAKRGHPDKPDGVYSMDVKTGVETYLAPGTSYSVFSRTSAEVFYVAGSKGTEAGKSTLRVDAVSTVDFRVRTLKRFPEAVFVGPPVQNCDGSYVALCPLTGGVADEFNSLSEQCVIVTPQGEPHPKWLFEPKNFKPYNADFAIWHPTDPKVVITRRFTSPTEVATRAWNIDTAKVACPGRYVIGHNAWHPSGKWFMQNDLWDTATGTLVRKSNLGGPHKDINPADKDKGLAARVVHDGDARAGRLVVQRLDEAKGATTKDEPVQAYCLHYTDFFHNACHPHPHWSPDGKAVLWQTNVQYLAKGKPPGGVGPADNRRTVDLFIALDEKP